MSITASYKGLFGIAASFMLLSAGCASEVNSVAAEVDPSGWPAGQAAQAAFSNQDTLSLREIEVFIVCNGKFAHDSLELFLTTFTPDSLSVTEKITIYPSGEASNTRYRQINQPYRGKVLLTKTGEYRFEFRHGYASLKGIKAVGINVENDSGTL